MIEYDANFSYELCVERFIQGLVIFVMQNFFHFLSHPNFSAAEKCLGQSSPPDMKNIVS